MSKEVEIITFNLIHDKWISVIRRDGTREKIAPWQMTEDLISNPIDSLDAPRSDFNGALVQFLIGLVQTTIAPNSEREWKNILKNVPTPESLKAAFSNVSSAFEFDGDTERFMQDYDLDAQTTVHVDKLLVEMPGDQTIRKNADHFLKRDSVNGMCNHCCATALFALQTNAPAGGQGNRTSLRGGGPLTTIVMGENLWQTVWLNILVEESFKNLGDVSRTKVSDIFPWMGPTRTSEKKQKTSSSHVNPKQMFWGMPRRIRMIFDETAEGICDVCGHESNRLIKKYISKNYGVNYEDGWRHVLTPHTEKKNVFLPQHVNPGGITYRHWLGLVQNDTDGSKAPALVVNTFMDRQSIFEGLDDVFHHQPRLWAFGYDFDNMKARCWYESQMPLIQIEDDVRDSYETIVAGLIKTSEIVAYNIRGCVKQAIDPNGVSKGNLSFVDTRFWNDTESEFYLALNNLHDALLGKNDILAMKRQWLRTLSKIAYRLFDEYSQCQLLDVTDPKNIALARRNLRFYNSESNKKIADVLDLPKKPKAKKGGKK